MKCPVDGRELVMSERSGVEIDYCPECRGVWLDRGELDRIAARLDDDARSGSSRSDGSDRSDRRDRIATEPSHKKKKSWFSELMEFGD